MQTQIGPKKTKIVNMGKYVCNINGVQGDFPKRLWFLPYYYGEAKRKSNIFGHIYVCMLNYSSSTTEPILMNEINRFAIMAQMI